MKLLLFLTGAGLLPLALFACASSPPPAPTTPPAAATRPAPLPPVPDEPAPRLEPPRTRESVRREPQRYMIAPAQKLGYNFYSRAGPRPKPQRID